MSVVTSFRNACTPYLLQALCLPTNDVVHATIWRNTLPSNSVDNHVRETLTGSCSPPFFVSIALLMLYVLEITPSRPP